MGLVGEQRTALSGEQCQETALDKAENLMVKGGYMQLCSLTITCQPYTEPQEYRTTSLEISKSLFIVNEDQPFLSETVKTRLSGNPL